MATTFKITEWQDFGKSGMVQLLNKRFDEQLTIMSSSEGVIHIEFDDSQTSTCAFTLSKDEIKAVIEFLQKRI